MPTKLPRALAAVTGAVAITIGPLALPAQAAEFELQIIGINDFHGRLLPVGETEDDPPQEIGGAEQLAGAVAELEAGFAGDTLFASAGDNIGASTFISNVQGDVPTLEALNAMGLDASAVGNHEFDLGFDDIAPGGRVDQVADFPYLGANVYAAGTQDPVLEEYFIADDLASGVTVGFIGTVTEETASLVSPDGIADIEFGDPAEATNRVADQLTDGDESNGEADVVVMLTHEGSSESECADITTSANFGDIVQGVTGDVDAIISGHTNNAYACELTSAQAGGFSGPVVQGGEYGETFATVTLTYDDVAAEVTGSSAVVQPVVGYPQDANAEVSAIIDAAQDVAAEVGAEPVGEITQDITRAFTEDGTEDRGAESVLGNFIADVQLAGTQEAGAQIAFMNPGGLRSDFLVDDQFADEAPGVVTFGEANAVQPFANGVVTMTLTGAQIVQVLEEQWQPEGSSRDFLALGVSDGFHYVYDPDAPDGEHIVEVTLNGEALDADAEYRVTVNSFLAAGGDNFFTLAEGTDRQELGVTDLEVLIDYFQLNSPVTPDTEDRAVIGTGDDDGDPGDDGGQNPGMGVDTGWDGGSEGSATGWGTSALAFLSLLALGVLTGVARRRRSGASH